LYHDWEERINKVAEANAKLAKGQNAMLANAGNLASGPQFEAWQKQMVTSGFTREQAQKAFTGAGAGAPTLGFAGQAAIAAEAMRAAPTGKDIGAHAELAGRLSMAMPKASPRQLSNIVQYLQTTLGARKSGELLSEGFLGGVRALGDTGAATPEQAIGMGAAASLAEMPTGIVERLAAKVNAPMEHKGRRGARLTEDEVIHNRFADASGPERLKMLLTDPEVQRSVLGERLAGRFPRLTDAAIQAQAAGVLGAEGGDLVGAQLTGLESTSAGRQAIWEQGEASKTDQLAMDKLERARSYTNAKDFVQRTIDQRASKEKWSGVRRWIAQKDFELSTFGEWVGNSQVTGQDIIKNAGISLNEGNVNEFSAGQEYIDKGSGTLLDEIKGLRGDINTNQSTNAAAAARTNGKE
jgi:hypothetical protein